MKKTLLIMLLMFLLTMVVAVVFNGKYVSIQETIASAIIIAGLISIYCINQLK